MNRCLYCYQAIDGKSDFHKTCSKKFFGIETAPLIDYSFDQMEELAKNVVKKRITVPGVQPKLSMSFSKNTDRRLNVVGMLNGNYIFKPPPQDYEEMPANEHLTMRMVELYGIEVVSSSLIRLKSGELSYITKRIDRTDNGEKIHMLDMFQITEAYEKYKSSMEKVGKALDKYSVNPLLDKVKLFEISLFSFLTGNNDMHLKNFSMILNNNSWKLAPAYDLLNVAIILPDDKEELALTLGGKKRKLTRDSFDAFAQTLNLNNKQTQNTYKRFIKNRDKAYTLIQDSFLSDDMKVKYLTLLDDRYKIITL